MSLAYSISFDRELHIEQNLLNITVKELSD
jgi:hypothetical protein